jgi:hypothetical protein
MPIQVDHTAVAARVPVLLRTLAGPGAAPHPDQLAAIQAVVAERRRVLVVQRTGWGKSAVYFLATRLLRDAGAGPTFLISPLLALMRDQTAAAERSACGRPASTPPTWPTGARSTTRSRPTRWTCCWSPLSGSTTPA